MDRIKSFSKKYPFIMSAVIMVSGMLILMLPIKRIFIGLTGVYNDYTRYFIGFAVRTAVSVVIIVFLMIMGYGKKLTPNFWFKHLLIICPAFIILIANFPFELISSGYRVTEDKLLIFLFGLKCLGVGLFEELIFRGAILTLLLIKWVKTKNGVYKAVIISSIMFGCMHLINLINGLEFLPEILGQVLYTSFLGLLFAAIVLRTKNIWLAVIIHSLFDFEGDCMRSLVRDYIPNQNETNSIILNVLVFIPIVFYSFYILRRINSEKLI